VPDGGRFRGSRVLVVDDDGRSAETVAGLLRDQGCLVTVVRDAYGALARLGDERFDAIVVELALPGDSGLDLLEAMERPLPAVLVTAMHAGPIAGRARAAGARAVLHKPVDEAELLDAVRSALASHAR
jgi:two-component system phosphate regulon response regulator OmpR